MEAVVASAEAPLDLRLENLTGLSGPVSGRSRPPKAPALLASTPFHVRVHERDERLDVAGAERFVGLANVLHRTNVRAQCGEREGLERGWDGPARVGGGARAPPCRTLGAHRVLIAGVTAT